MPPETIGAQEARLGSCQETLAQALDRRSDSVSLGRGAAAGLIGGLAGTVVMDLVLFAMHHTVGAPDSASFDTIGDSAAVLCSKAGMDLPGGAATGALLHFLIGSGFGVAFGVGLVRIQALRQGSPRTVAGLGALYGLVASQPLLATAAITLKMSRAEAAKWYGISLTHAVYGSVLGAVAAYGLRSGQRRGG